MAKQTAKVVPITFLLVSRYKAMAALTLIAIMLASILPLPPVSAYQRPDSFADLVEKLSPAVVNISASQVEERRRLNLPKGFPFGNDFFNFRGENNQNQEPRRTQSLGSGFLIDASGLIVTNNHVVEKSDEITVFLANGDSYSAEVVGRDPKVDLAVIKIEREEPFPFVPWGDSEAERVGDWVIAIGNPFGLGGSVTSGILSARGRAPAGGSGSEVDFIQTDAAINRGNSGGPLFNTDGQVIGINTAIFSPSGGSVGIGFAIPSNDAELIVSELIENGRVRRGWLGVSIQTFTDELAASKGLEEGGGIIITSINPDGPAQKYGFKVGDIILNWAGKETQDSRELQRAVARTRVGDTIKVKVMRDQKEITLSVEVAEQPADLFGSADPEASPENKSPLDDHVLVQGMDLLPLNDLIRERFSINEDVQGVFIARIDRSSAAFKSGFREGMVITQVNSNDVTEPNEIVGLIEEAIAAERPSVLALISTGAGTLFLALPVEADE